MKIKSRRGVLTPRVTVAAPGRPSGGPDRAELYYCPGTRNTSHAQRPTFAPFASSTFAR
jgi:hypothetical protein